MRKQMHKCEGCRFKGEHQEMGFKAVGVCTKELLLPDAIKAYTEPECKFGVKPRTTYNIPKKDEIITEMGKHTEVQDAFNEYAAVLKKTAQGALNAYTTNLAFGGKPDQREEDWIEALFCGMQSIGLVEELQQQLSQVKKQLDAAIADIPKTCGYCKFFNWDVRNCMNEMTCSCVGGTHNLWRWQGESE